MDRTKSTRKSHPAKELTCIPRRIHCATTPDADGIEEELDRIAIDAFLDTLAETTLAIVRRRAEWDSSRP